MRTALYAIGLAAAAVGIAAAVTAMLVPDRVRPIAWLRCWVRGRHEPRRAPQGGQRCSDCGLAGADLEAMGFEDGAYVPTRRRLYDRDRREFTRTSAWDQTRGGW